MLQDVSCLLQCADIRLKFTSSPYKVLFTLIKRYATCYITVSYRTCCSQQVNYCLLLQKINLYIKCYVQSIGKLDEISHDNFCIDNLNFKHYQFIVMNTKKQSTGTCTQILLMNMSDTYSLLHVCIGNTVLLLYICVLKYRTYDTYQYVYLILHVYEYIYIEIVHIHEKIPKHL